MSLSTYKALIKPDMVSINVYKARQVERKLIKLDRVSTNAYKTRQGERKLIK